MYKIYADNTLIYDSTLEDYKIGKGSVTLETNKSGSFTFSIYPDHFFYDNFVRLKTVITVYKSGRIVFRGRILSDVTDYWNNKVITCEGELGFLQDSIIRPFSFSGTPEALFKKFVEEHNSQVDEFKRFKIGTVTVVDPNSYIARENSGYESALSNLNSRLIEDSLGGYFYITHGEDGTDPIPTINYLADFTNVATQVIEFGSNLKNYTKTVKAEDIATAIIPLGATIEKETSDEETEEETTEERVTIMEVNDGKDYVYSEEGVGLYGWIFKSITWDDVTEAANLKTKAEAYLEGIVKQTITIELTAIDLHLLDHSIESFHVGDYIRVISLPHNFDSTLLCNKQTIDLLKPENDSLILGATYTTLTESNAKTLAMAVNLATIRSSISSVSNKLGLLNTVAGTTNQNAADIVEIIARLDALESGTSDLPSGYILLNYIRSDGKAYINTGVKPTNNTKIEVKVSADSGNFYAAMISTGGRFGLYVGADKTLDIAFGASGYISDIITGITFPAVITMANGVVTVGSQSATFSEQASFVTDQTLPLFGVNNKGTFSATGGDGYPCKIYENGVLIRDYVPCINANSEYGLYDKVDKLFYGNAGSGSFTGG